MAIKNPAPYRKFQKPYTRKSKVKSKGYIKTVPPAHVVKFVQGNSAKFNEGIYPFILRIVSQEEVQIRDVALESVRAHLHREIEEQIGADYYMAITVYPHHILREHKQAAVAQADRMSQGMSLSFGKPTGRAAQVPKNKPIFVFAFPTSDAVDKFRGIYHKIRPKLPCKTTLEVQKK